MADNDKIKLRCPCCNADLTVDQTTGEVLFAREAKAPLAGGKDFDTLLGDLDRGKAEAEQLFEREVSAFEDRDRLLEEKFKEAVEQAEDTPDDELPLRPFDLD